MCILVERIELNSLIFGGGFKFTPLKLKLKLKVFGCTRLPGYTQNNKAY